MEEKTLLEQLFKYLNLRIDGNEFLRWIAPLHGELDGNKLLLWAPNSFVFKHVQENYLNQITSIIKELCPKHSFDISLRVGNKTASSPLPSIDAKPEEQNEEETAVEFSQNQPNPAFTFEHYVVGKSNHIACAAAIQVSKNPGKAYNPLFVYGGVGLGKTHLMQAIGNAILKNNSNAQVLYLHSERFVADMVKALQRNSMNDFKRYYRSANALLIDDIQFFAGKDRSQEEFFHTFNSLLDDQQQIVITCDRYPKELSGLEERLKSRFGWGLTVAIEPPELETRVAILMSKAEQMRVDLPHEVAFFMAKRIQSNVRELEGALKRVVANSHFTGAAITLDFAREALKDLLAVQAKLVSIENIQKTVAEYYKIKIGDLLSKRRARFLAQARQVAMALSRELTNHSLPEIGEAFGGKDHTTVLHACQKVKELMADSIKIQDDYKQLFRILST